MPWIKVDDQWNNHPKVVGLSLAARGMWISGLVYAGQQLTDGFLADSVVKREGIGTDSDALAEELVAAGLWNRVEHGYQIHDYLDFNPSREEVMTKRKADLERKKRPSQQDSPQIPRGIQTESKRPVPVPVPLNEKDKSFSLTADAETQPDNISTFPAQKKRTPAKATQLPSGWEPTEDEVQYAKERGFSDPDITEIAEDFRLFYQSHGRAMPNWHLTFLRWVREAKKREDERQQRLVPRQLVQRPVYAVDTQAY